MVSQFNVSGSLTKLAGSSIHSFDMVGNGGLSEISLINCTFDVSSVVVAGDTTQYLGIWFYKINLDSVKDVQWLFSGSGSTEATWTFGIEFRFVSLSLKRKIG